MTTATLDILTLNTWGFRWPLAKDRDLRFARIRQHLATHRYDAVAFQELWGSSPTALGDTGYAWVGDDAQLPRGLRRNDSGLGFKVRDSLSRGADAMKRMAQAFRRAAGFDRLKRKGFQTVELPAGDLGRVTLVNTHLQAGANEAAIRRSQLDELLAAVETIATPVVLCGDFNLFRDSDEDRAAHRSLFAAGFVDASEAIDRPEPTYLSSNPYVPTQEGNQRFDRIYVRDGAHDGQRLRLRPADVRVIVDHAAPLSDHEGVRARILVERW
jgi:endonuclease/exonuclease/phosphatase family metal-dependent hydrolase